MRHEKEIDQFLRDMIYEDWMDEYDYNEVVSESLRQAGTNKQEISDGIEIGVRNGYSIETQFALIKRSLWE